MKKVLTIIGTRPEAIKLLPVIKELEKYPQLVTASICSTGQHREMLDQLIGLFELHPNIDLALMEEDQTLSRLTARAMIGLTEVLSKGAYDAVLVQGDTTTAMVAALAAFYQKIPVGHVEAGLRTYDRYNPFPEECNRRLISALATWHFAPTPTAVEVLRSEGVPEKSIFLTGNTVVDTLHMILAKNSNAPTGLPVESRNRLVLVTAHRRENFGEPLRNICTALRLLAERNPDIEVVYPVHPNPNVQRPVRELLDGCERVHLLPPVDYETFVHWMHRSYLILTDSGGIQEEAPVLGKPVLVLRRSTERPEGVASGLAQIVGLQTDDIVRESEVLLRDADEYARRAQRQSLYGDGRAAERIVEVLLTHLRA